MLATTRIADDDRAPAPGSLDGRVVLVTGATGGVGRETALAAAAAGATVVLLGRKVRALEAAYDAIEAAGGARPAVYPMDLSGATPDDHVEAVAAIEREFGRLDGLVHAAAHFDALQPFDQLPPAEFARCLTVNLAAPYLLTRAAVGLMRKSADAAIVFVLDAPERMGKAFWGGYGVSKQGLATLASIVHEETERSSVRTHALLPPPMRTALRRAAYYGENTSELPGPGIAAAAIVRLLGADGARHRGRTLDLRAASGAADDARDRRRDAESA